MLPEDKLNRDIVRGARATELLNNELLQELLATVEPTTSRRGIPLLARDTDGRERLWQAVNIFGTKRRLCFGRRNGAHNSEV